MEIIDAIKILEKHVPNPSEGLPDDIFYYISRTTPLINVDLLVKDEKNRTLLSWRADSYAGVGWHIPGGIIRFKETIENRIHKVAQLEIGVDHIDFDPNPIGVNQIITNGCDIRGHFISLLYKCNLSSRFIPDNKGINLNSPGYLKWHNSCPDDLLKFHEIYRKYL